MLALSLGHLLWVRPACGFRHQYQILDVVLLLVSLVDTDHAKQISVLRRALLLDWIPRSRWLP